MRVLLYPTSLLWGSTLSLIISSNCWEVGEFKVDFCHNMSSNFRLELHLMLSVLVFIIESKKKTFTNTGIGLTLSGGGGGGGGGGLI